MIDFTIASVKARRTKIKAEALILLEVYAAGGFATYPVDAELIRHIWPNEDPEGFTLTAYNAGNIRDGYTVTKTAVASQFKPSKYVSRYAADLTLIQQWLERNGAKVLTIYGTSIGPVGGPRIHVCDKSAKRLGLTTVGVLTVDTETHFEATMEGVEVKWIVDAVTTNNMEGVA